MADEVTLILEEYSAYTDARMRAVIAGRRGVGRLYDMMRYHLGWVDDRFSECRASRGKSLRSTMCLLACEAICGDRERALPAAAAVELLHNFSLIHDDIEDGDEKRRHRDTLWKLWGVPQAINTGDAMDIIANLSLLDLDGSVRPEMLVEIVRLFNETVIELCEGQYLDMDFQGRGDVSVGEYVAMVSGKTAALIEAATAIGAMVATEDEDIIRRFRTFGREIGVAFQIRDDILGIWGDPESTGKSAKNDIRNRKKSLPVLYAMEKSEHREEMKRIYARESLGDDDVARVFDVLTAAGSLEYAQAEARRYMGDAMAQFDGLELHGAPMGKLHAIGRFLVERDY